MRKKCRWLINNLYLNFMLGLIIERDELGIAINKMVFEVSFCHLETHNN